MTPLAYEWVTRRADDRYTNGVPEKKWQDRTPIDLSDIHCFEVTQVFDLIEVVVESAKVDFDGRIFLPFEKTWIEWFDSVDKIRSGVMLFPDPIRPDHAGISWFYDGFGYIVGSIPTGEDVMDRPVVTLPSSGLSLDAARMLCRWALAAVYVLNSPRVVGRTDHEPHSILKKEARRKGAKPPHRWSTITLSVTDRGRDNDGATTLHGERALHHVRKFGRVRLGKLEIVRDHWRGDAKNGIISSSHRVVP